MSNSDFNSSSRFYTYMHTRNDTGAVFYVGKGRGTLKRAYDSSNRNRHWNSVVAKHGHSVSIIEHFDNEQDAFAYERYLIASYRAFGVSLCNMTDGGEGSSGRVYSNESLAKMRDSHIGKTPSEATKAKLSAANKGKAMTRGHTLSAEHRAKIGTASKGNTHNLGRKLSAEHCAKISATTKGRPKPPFTIEHRAKLSAASKGQHPSPEARAKMSASQTGRRHSAESLAKMSDARKLFWAKKRKLRTDTIKD